MKLLSFIPSFIKSKFFIAAAVFAVVILFLDRNNFFTRLERDKELRDLEKSKQHYTSEIAAEQKELQALKTNPATLEKYAREKYLMKRDNEDLFIISEKSDPAKN